MKQYFSVFALIAQNSIYKIFGLLLLMAAADFCLAYYHLQVQHSSITNIFRTGGGSGFGIVLAVTFVLITVILIRCGDIYSGSQGYTMQRLGLSDRAIFGLQCLYCGFCWVILWGVQLAVLFAICKIYYASPEIASDPLNGQQIFLLFYTSELLHSLLPMEDGLAWAANLSMVCGLAVSTAYWITRRRNGKPTGQLIFVYWIVLLFFRRELDNFLLNLAIIVYFAIVIGLYTWRGFSRKKEV